MASGRRPRTTSVMAAAVVVLVLLGGCRGSSASPDAASTSSATPDGGAVELSLRVPVDGAELAVQVRGDDTGAPLLLVLHGGPGFAMIDLLHETVPQLEEHFVTVNFDQRGAGLSYSPEVDPGSITLDQLVADADVVRQAVLDQLGGADRPVFVMGHSMGTMVALELVRRSPSRYAAYVGVGQLVDVVANEQASYDAVLAEAEARDDATARSQLECVGRPSDDFTYAGCARRPLLDGFEVTACWVGRFGGDVWGASSDEPVLDEVLASPAYRDHEDDWFAGLELSQALFDDPAVISWDAAVAAAGLTVPVFVLQGHHDLDTPWPLAESWAAALTAPHRLGWFERSSHFPFFEEPDAFAAVLVAVADGSWAPDGTVVAASPPGPEPDHGDSPPRCG